MLGLCVGRLPCLLDVKIQQVVEMDVVASARHHRGVGAGTASDVDQPRGLRRQEAVEQLQGSRELQARLTPSEETIALKTKLVVRGDRIVNHRRSLAGSGHVRFRTWNWQTASVRGRCIGWSTNGQSGQRFSLRPPKDQRS